MTLLERPAQGPPRSPFLRQLSPLRKGAVAVAVYALWTALTWLLEGRIQTLLRPEAVLDRLVYTGVANVLVGSILALLVVREYVASGFTARSRLGFQGIPRTLVTAVVGGGLGFALYLLQGPPTTDPVVLANVFAQVLPVSIAEVVICWVLVGGSVASLLRDRGVNGYLADVTALVVSSVLFGGYHVAHSPPFNTVAMVGLLTVVGLGTGVVYFVGGTFYGALAFHNVMALFGVVSSLADAGQIGTFEQPILPLLATAIVALVVVVGMERVFVRDPDGHRRGKTL